MTGYFGDDAPPSPIDEDGFLHTGDSGYWNDLGHLVITGRKKDMLTVGGFNVYPAELVEWCARRVANYKAPRHVVLLDQLPMTPSGKIQKSELRRSLLPGRTSA